MSMRRVQLQLVTMALALMLAREMYGVASWAVARNHYGGKIKMAWTVLW